MIKVYWAFDGKVFVEEINEQANGIPKVGQLRKDKDGFRYLITEIREILWHKNEYEAVLKPFPILEMVDSFEALFKEDQK